MEGLTQKKKSIQCSLLSVQQHSGDRQKEQQPELPPCTIIIKGQSTSSLSVRNLFFTKERPEKRPRGLSTQHFPNF